MKKTIKITLKNGEKVEVGLKEHNALKKAMKNQNPKEIAKATFRVLLSSKSMMKKLTDDTLNALKKFKR